MLAGVKASHGDAVPMSVFAPINDDHAVESVKFELVLNALLPPDLFELLHGSHSAWREELPAVQLGGNYADGMTFSYLRPDGSFAWQMKIEPALISICCNRYTRWEKIWRTSRSLFARAFDALGEAECDPPIAIERIRLQVSDKFVAEDKDYELAELFADEEGWLPSAIRAVGPVWHSNAGWFEPEETGAVLHNLNLSSARKRKGTSPAFTVQTAIVHLQEKRLKDALQLDTSSKLIEYVDQVMAQFHNRNKAVITRLLKPNVALRIGLISSEG